MDRKWCNLCNTRISYKHWSKHFNSEKHKNNDPDRTLKPKRRGRPKIIKLYLEFKFRKSFFQEPNVCTIVRTKERAYRSRLSILQIENYRYFLDIKQFLNNVERVVTGNIRKEHTRINCLKDNIVLFAEFEKNEPQQINFEPQNEIRVITRGFICRI
jgi:hypothetical protein